MKSFLPDLVLNKDILSEPTVDENRLALWLPTNRHHNGQHWERIATVAHAEVLVQQEMCAIAATSVRANQRIQGLFGRICHRWQSRLNEELWTLPNGATAEQYGVRQTDLLLVWSSDSANLLNETQIHERWPEANRVQQLGPNLFLVAGVTLPTTTPPQSSVPSQASPRMQAEDVLAAARQARDRGREVSALSDLGVFCLRDGDYQRAAIVLEEALALTGLTGDRAAAHDVQSNLGMALLSCGQLARARQLFQAEMANATASRDVFAQKTALFHLGLLAAYQGDPGTALAYFGQALILARQAGDRQDEADLLWHQAIQHADLGQRDQVFAKGQAAVTVLQKAGKPQAAWFEDHLHKYRSAIAGSPTANAQSNLPALGGGVFITSSWAAPPAPMPGNSQPQGPSLLRMAFTAVQAMTKFIASGCKRVNAEIHAKRIQTCQTCEHHTGLRCRLCGCFTATKAWMRHEECPKGKWPI